MVCAGGDEDPLVGRVIAERFRVESVLGSGGMGTVYRALQTDIGRPVAVKVLKPELQDDPRLGARFVREALAVSRIASPHVVTVYDFGQWADRLYLAMELVDGESLAARLARERPLGVGAAIAVALGVTRALDAAHQVSVVHRDLKPDNVMLAGDGRIKVVDFGIAKLLEGFGDLASRQTITGLGAIAGTPRYISPEAATRKQVGPRADLYALGVILFEMLTGSPPFHDDEPVLLLGMHVRVPPQLLSEARPDLAFPRALEALVDRLLEKRPEARPRSAEDVVSVLSALAHDEARRQRRGPGVVDPLLASTLDEHLDGPTDRVAGAQPPAVPVVVRALLDERARPPALAAAAPRPAECGRADTSLPEPAQARPGSASWRGPEASPRAPTTSDEPAEPGTAADAGAAAPPTAPPEVEVVGPSHAPEGGGALPAPASSPSAELPASRAGTADPQRDVGTGARVVPAAASTSTPLVVVAPAPRREHGRSRALAALAVAVLAGAAYLVVSRLGASSTDTTTPPATTATAPPGADAAVAAPSPDETAAGRGSDAGALPLADRDAGRSAGAPTGGVPRAGAPHATPRPRLTRPRPRRPNLVRDPGF